MKRVVMLEFQPRRSCLASGPGAGSLNSDPEPCRLAEGRLDPEQGKGNEAALQSGTGSPRWVVEPEPSWEGLIPGAAKGDPAPMDAESETQIPVRLLIVDDSHIFLGTLRRILQTLPGILVVGTTTSAREALELLDELHPDLVLIDIGMPGLDGLEATRQLCTRPRRPRIIFMSLDDLPEIPEAARAAGADAFLSKSDMVNQLQPLIRSLFKRSGPNESQPA
jgi:CheY-like chemotaxis protein